MKLTTKKKEDENVLKDSLIIIGGPSGSGKTVIVDKLCEEFPLEFEKLKQVTTRSMRENESQNNPYWFINDDQYDSIKDKLIFTTEREHGKYGTIPTQPNQSTNSAKVVIADISALQKLTNKESSTYIQCTAIYTKILIICINYDKDLEVNQYRMKGREGRDNSFYDEFVKYADFTLMNDHDKWITPSYLEIFIKTTFSINKYTHKYSTDVVINKLRQKFN